jgi:hypothetical protein
MKLEEMNPEQIKGLMKLLSHNMEDTIKALGIERVLFVLLLFCPGEDGLTNYISNCNREDIIKALRDAADHLERKSLERK